MSLKVEFEAISLGPTFCPFLLLCLQYVYAMWCWRSECRANLTVSLQVEVAPACRIQVRVMTDITYPSGHPWESLILSWTWRQQDAWVDRRQDMKNRTARTSPKFGELTKERGVIMDGFGGPMMVVLSLVGLPQWSPTFKQQKHISSQFRVLPQLLCLPCLACPFVVTSVSSYCHWGLATAPLTRTSLNWD